MATNNLELTGKVVAVLPTQSGTSKNGVWTKKEFVLEVTDGQFPKKVAFSLFNEAAKKVVKVGEDITVGFNLESREYNGRYYTEAKAWKIAQATPKEEFADAPAGDDSSSLPF